MLSIIICSISSEHLNVLKQNIQQTIGVEYEVIAINNQENHWSIAKAYNYGAQQAKYPYLFFVHEDVRLHSVGWGNFIVRKLSEPDCGVVGFAGSKLRMACHGGWYQVHEGIVSYLYQKTNNGLARFVVANAYFGRPFEEVITLDGLGMFVRKEVWEKYPFDEELLTGFHCYDIDFSLQIAYAKYKNYVCCSNQLLIEHFSMGNFNSRDWLSVTIRLHDKWHYLLPLKVAELALSDDELRLHEERNSYSFLKKVLRSNCERSDKKKVFKQFWTRPFSWKHFRNCLSVSLKYIRYV